MVLPLAAVTLTVTVKAPVEAGLTVPTAQVTVPAAPTAGVVQVAPGALTEAKVVPAGSTAVTTVLGAASMPLLE